MNKSFYLRPEDFNRSIFDLEQFLLEHSDLGYSCFLYEDPCYQCFLIETVKYSRKCLVVTSLPIWAQQDSIHVMLGIWQCNRVVKGTVNTSCLYEGTERVMCGRCCLAVVVLKFPSCRPILSVIILVIKKIGLPLRVSYDFGNHSYDYRPNWTPLGQVTIIHMYIILVTWMSPDHLGWFYFRRLASSVKC